MEKYEQVNKPKKTIFIDNFIGGIGWAFGATVGLAFIVAVIGLILKHVNLIPFLGNFVAGIIEFVVNKNPGLFTK